MSHSPAGIALSVAAGLAAGAVLVRPAVFALSIPEGIRTSCPGCGRQVIGSGSAGYIDLVVRRRCRSCPTPPTGTRLGPVALLPELLTAAGMSAAVAGGSSGWLLAAQLWLAVTGASMLLIDASVKRLPDLLTGAAAAGVAVLLCAAAVTDGQWAALGRIAAAAGVVSAVFMGLALLGMGVGDAKLAPTLAALLGWHSWTAVYWGIGAGFLLGAVHALLLIVGGRAGRKTELAFGPALLAGALAVSVLVS